MYSAESKYLSSCCVRLEVGVGVSEVPSSRRGVVHDAAERSTVPWGSEQDCKRTSTLPRNISMLSKCCRARRRSQKGGVSIEVHLLAHAVASKPTLLQRKQELQQDDYRATSPCKALLWPSKGIMKLFPPVATYFEAKRSIIVLQLAANNQEAIHKHPSYAKLYCIYQDTALL